MDKFNTLAGHIAPKVGITEFDKYSIVFDTMVLVKDLYSQLPEVDPDDEFEVNTMITPTQLADATKTLTLVEAVWNIKNLKVLKTLGKDQKASLLTKYLARLRTHGYKKDNMPGAICLDAQYVLRGGRQYAVGASLQCLSAHARAMAWQGKSLDLDIVNSVPSAVPSACVHLATEHGLLELIPLYVSHTEEWRNFLSSYYDVSPVKSER